MKVLIPTKAAIVLFGLIFIYAGINHMQHGPQMASFVPVPGGSFWIYFTGAAMVAAGIAFCIGKPARIAGYLLALLLIIYIIAVHIPSYMSGRLDASSNILKDLGLAAAAIIIANIAPEKKNRAVV